MNEELLTDLKQRVEQLEYIATRVEQWETVVFRMDEQVRALQDQLDSLHELIERRSQHQPR